MKYRCYTFKLVTHHLDLCHPLRDLTQVHLLLFAVPLNAFWYLFHNRGGFCQSRMLIVLSLVEGTMWYVSFMFLVKPSLRTFELIVWISDYLSSLVLLGKTSLHYYEAFFLLFLSSLSQVAKHKFVCWGWIYMILIMVMGMRYHIKEIAFL